MGNCCQQIKQNSFKKNSNVLLNSSFLNQIQVKLPKLRDFFASYKSICDNFSIDLIEFQHIFGAGQSSFVIWDTDNNGLIDALQLFAGIAVFSDTKLEDKVRCTFNLNLVLFDVFDFNEVQYLEQVQLEFMIVCVVNAAYKIFGISNEPANQQIQDFVRELFFETNKITVADLIKKSKETKKIQQFFQVIKGQNKKSQQKVSSKNQF